MSDSSNAGQTIRCRVEAPLSDCMSKFAAKFGYTRQNMANSPDLHLRLLIRYAKDHGHDPTGLTEWTMVVAKDGSVTFYPYLLPEDPDTPYDRGWTDQTPLSNPPQTLD